MNIKDLKENCLLDDVFYIESVTKGVSATSNSPYLSVIFSDKTGTIDGRKWDVTLTDGDVIKAGNFVRVNGTVNSYKDKLQIKITSCSLVDPSQVDRSDFINSSPIPIADLEKELDKYIGLIKSTNLHTLTSEIIERRRTKFINGVAATKIHHDFIGGLLYHTVSMCGLAVKITEHLNQMYPKDPVNLSLLLAGCILHDIGKIEEIEVDNFSHYSEKGILMGHISLGFTIVSETAHQLNLNGIEEVTLLEHMILSHHGKQEYGSPVLPMFKEAFLLSMIDDMDSKVCFIDKTEGTLDEGEFSNKLFAFDNRVLYKPKKK